VKFGLNLIKIDAKNDGIKPKLQKLMKLLQEKTDRGRSRRRGALFVCKKRGKKRKTRTFAQILGRGAVQRYVNIVELEKS